MEKAKLTVFTPTYNRAYILDKLYKSLCSQTDDRFEWLIVDDGSTDETEFIIKKWIQDNKIKIQYFKQENGGKQRAHNKGVELCTTPLFVCVDSDDYVLQTFVEDHLKIFESVEYRDEIAGIVSLQKHDDGKLISTQLPEGIKESSLTNLYNNLHFSGDVTLAYKTDILQQYPFIVENGEKFIGENYVYDQIDQKYKMVLLSKPLLVKEYLNDGYTTNVRRLTKNNPNSYMRLKRQCIVLAPNLKTKIASTILYEVGGILAKKPMISDAPDKILAIICYLPAWLAWLIFYKNA